MRIIDYTLAINSSYYHKILQLIQAAGGVSRLVGGAVRDAWLGRNYSDLDIATDLLPEQVIQVMKAAHLRALPTGLKFGTVTVLCGAEQFEITTLRKDLSSNGRRPVVSFTDSFAEDAARRDFTINALSYCPFSQQIYDYFGGLDDLKNSRVVFIGSPLARIQEDYLRILRFFRFSCDYAGQLEPAGLAAATELKNHLASLSQERIKIEMDKLVASANAAGILQIMFDCGILAVIWPLSCFSSQFLSKAAELAAAFSHQLETLTKYSLIFMQALQLTRLNLVHLKFSKSEIKQIFKIIDFTIILRSAADNNQRLLILRTIWLEESHYLQYIIAAASCGALNIDLASEFVSNYQYLQPPKFPLTGHDLLAIKITNGDIGQYLQKLKERWIMTNFSLSAAELITSLHQ